MIFDSIDSCRENFFTVLVDAILKQSVILLETYPRVEVRLHAKVSPNVLSCQHVFLRKQYQPDSRFFHLAIYSLNILSDMVSESK